MRILAGVLVAAALLQGCGEARSEAAALGQPTAETAATTESSEILSSDDAMVRFSDILDQYRALNERLETVAARLQIANAELCPATLRDPGYTVHTITDYPTRLQQVARGLLNVEEGLSVRTVRAGSAAQIAGLQPGDKLMGLNGQRLPGGHAQQKLYETAAAKAFAGPSARLTIARDVPSFAAGTDRPEVMSFKLTPETICAYPSHVVFDEYVNGHTDGRAVWITSELMRTVEDDVNLALIVAHEMSHAMAGHLALNAAGEARKILELTADSMALVMLVRAGFETDSAIAYWTRADNPQRMSQSRSDTHPSITQRLNNFEAVKQAIINAERRGDGLDFSILPNPVL